MKKYIFAFLSVVFEFIANKIGMIQFEGEPAEIEISVNDTTFKVTQADFAKAIEQKKLLIKDDNTMIFEKPDYETRLKNIEELKYKEGKRAGVEMLAKDLKKSKGLEDIEGKDIEALFETYAERKIKAAKLPESEKLKDAEKIIGELRTNLNKLETDNKTLISDYTKKEQQFVINNTLAILIPDAAVTPKLSRTDIMALFRANGYDASVMDGKVVATKDGEIIKHGITLEPTPLKDVIYQFVNDKDLIKKEGGRGAGDDTGISGFGTWDAFVKEMVDKGIMMGSQKFQDEQNLRIKNKTLKV
jgi:hypothetical protein